MNGIENLMFTTTRKHAALLSDLIGPAEKLASEMSAKWQELGGRDKGREEESKENKGRI